MLNMTGKGPDLQPSACINLLSSDDETPQKRRKLSIEVLQSKEQTQEVSAVSPLPVALEQKFGSGDQLADIQGNDVERQVFRTLISHRCFSH